MLKQEGSTQAEQLQMVLNMQTDGIALIEQHKVVFLKQPQDVADNSLSADRNISFGLNESDRSKAYLVEQSVVQYLNVHFCNDALAELIQCELKDIDFS